MTRLASEKIGKDLFWALFRLTVALCRQVHLVRLPQGSSENLEVITVNDASHEACSMSGVEMFVVARRLGKR